MTPEHPSFLDLDHVALGVGDAEVAAHAGSCSVCGAYLAGLRLGDAPTPGWVAELAPRRTRRTGRWLAAGVGLAMAAAVVLSVAPSLVPPSPEAAYVGTKGEPAVVVYLRRDGEVRRLEAGEPIRPGDSLRLGVPASGFAWVTVRDGAGPQATVLYEGPLVGTGEVLLPTGWRVDGEAGPETLEVWLRPRDGAREPWHVSLSFDKELP